MKLSDRYEVQTVIATCAGWSIARGFDVRLGRPVLVATQSGRAFDRYAVDTWLARRVSISHAYVAELFDALPTDDGFYCVFESRKNDLLGFPDLSRYELLSACVKITEAVECLVQAGIAFAFSDQQIIWDGEYPHVLGLLSIPSEERSGAVEMHVNALSQYIADRLQKRINLSNDPGRILERSPVLRVGLQRLRGEVASCTTFADLRMILEAMLIAEQRRKMALQSNQEQAGEEFARPSQIDEEKFHKMETLEFQAPTRAHHVAKEGFAAGKWDVYANNRSQLPQKSVEREEEHEDNGVLSRNLRMRTVLIVILSVIAALAIIYGGVRAMRNGMFGANTPRPSIETSGQMPKKEIKVLGLSPSAAISLLTSHGIHVVRVEAVKLMSGEIADTVVGSQPALQSVASPVRQVTLQVAIPSGYKLVPNLLTRTLQEAQQQLLADHFPYSYVIQNDPGAVSGEVIKQNPMPFTMQLEQSNVTFIVAQNS
ncbi:hypothetical protein [Sulfoacidibacillus thermotolerans]|uniref:PASTA domain-containing protein n=1 Tax=Sulfoacidibacillus thermotolerans TaxID=1765684 RepID=A0A2U3DA71_SULT2|nr:hypothetical protein [Sulfoacidibacillus thermotolerans]PWI58165.1 hypothetical protein BM613_04305 [Sulfoacidibacillus thermotolerans]